MTTTGRGSREWLYHYTCIDHGAVGIDRDRLLRPHSHPWLPEPLVWLTDLETPIREALGLTSQLLVCDRLARRYTVPGDTAMWWPDYARRLPTVIRHCFEDTPGAMPAHWFVSTHPIAMVADSKAGEPVA